MQVLIVTSVHPSFDGRIWKHCKALTQRGVDVHLVCPWDVEAGSGPESVNFYPFRPAPGMKKRLTILQGRIIRKIREVVAKQSIDLIHFHDSDLLYLPFVFRSIPMVYDCHENVGEEVLLRPYIPRVMRPGAAKFAEMIERFLANRTGAVACAAPSQFEHFDKARVPYMLLGNHASRDLLDDLVRDWPDRPDNVIFLGTQHERNGSLIFLEAARLVHLTHPEVQFTAVDRFPSPEFKLLYMSKVEEYGLSSCLSLVPNIPAHEIMKTLNTATIAVNPNQRIKQQIRGNHTKMYEFMAAGLPIIASDLPHQEKLLADARCGLVANPDNPGSFGLAIQELIEAPATRLEMGANGLASFEEHYCYESQIDELLTLYTKIISVDAHSAVNS